MPLIEVRIPFTLRLCRECKGRHFHKGQHEVSRQEFEHWFVQGCIAEGRAVIVPMPEIAMETVAPGAPANHDEFTDAMGLAFGVDLAAEGAELTAIVKTAGGIIQDVKEIPAKKAAARPVAKKSTPKKAGK